MTAPGCCIDLAGEGWVDGSPIGGRPAAPGPEPARDRAR